MGLWTKSCFELDATPRSAIRAVGSSLGTRWVRSPTRAVAAVVNLLSTFAFAAAVFLLTSFSASNFAEAELNCDDSWTAAYKCLEGCGPCPDDSSGGNDRYDPPAPPQFDARADARNRIASLIANYSDVIDQGRWGSLASVDDGSFDASLGSLHHELWTEMAEAQMAVATRRPQIEAYSEFFRQYQDRDAKLNSVGPDGVPQERIDAKTQLEEKKATLESQIAASEPNASQDDLSAAYARDRWVKTRNDTLQQLRAALPEVTNLPDVANDASNLWQPPQPFSTDVPIDPPPTRSMPRLAQYSEFSDIDLTHVYTSPPEPAPSAEVTAKVAELEQIASWTRNARQDLKAVQDANAEFGTRYNSLARSVTERECNAENTKREVTFLGAQVARLEQVLQKANAEEHAKAWLKTLDGVRAAAWDIMREKVVMPEIEKLPHYADFDRAKKSADLVKQVLSLENDAEFYSSAAAETLALGPTSHTAEITANVWGATRQQAEASIDRAMDLIEAPADLKKAWKALLTSEQ